MSDDARILSPLIGAELNEERQCAVCKIPMKPLHRNQKNSKLPWRESGIDFECKNCKSQTYIANSNSVSIVVATAIVILSFIGYFLANGLFGFMIYSVQDSIVSVLLSLVAIGIMYFLGRYAWGKIKHGATLIEARIKNPLVNRKPGINMLNLSMTMGLLPWLIAIFLGYINNQYKLLDGSMIWLMMPIALLPIFLGSKVGATKMNVFLAAMFWLFIGWFVVWLAS